MRQLKPAKFPLLKLSVVSLALAASVGCTTVPKAYATTTDNYTAYAVDGEYQRADLDRMLAPIALYPDSLLSHILIAATYPLEVIQAERWVERNRGLSSERLLAAADSQDWDPSVKALVATPNVLQRMSEDLEWTQAVGEAFLAQQEDVLASIQTLRDRAYIAGNLRSDERVRVQREPDVIRIETVRREYVYVPVYDSRYVYGSWWHHRQPVYWDGFGVSVSFGHGIHWTLSYNVPSWYFFSDFYWRNRYVVVHHHHYHERDRRHRRDDYRPRPGDGDRWRHDPRHRRNVDYRHRDLVQNPPKFDRQDEPGRIVRKPVREQRPPQVELRRRLLEAEAEPRSRRPAQPRLEARAEQPELRREPRFGPQPAKPNKPDVRQPRFEPKPEKPVVRQPPRLEPKPQKPIVRKPERIERPQPNIKRPRPQREDVKEID